MATKERNDVDYFPHKVTHKQKMHYIQSKYKNDGYAVWFKLLEELAKQQFHFIHIDSPLTFAYMASNFLVDEIKLTAIINDLVFLGELDKELHACGVLFNQSFVDSIEDAYERRVNSIINRISLCKHLLAKGIHLTDKCIQYEPYCIEKPYIDPERKEDYTILKKTKEEYISPEFKDVFDMWLEYKAKRKQFYKSDKSKKMIYDKLVLFSKNDPEIALKIIQNAMKGPWSGFYELKDVASEQKSHAENLVDVSNNIKNRFNEQQ